MLGSRFRFCLDPTNDVSSCIGFGDGDMARSVRRLEPKMASASSFWKLGLTGRDRGSDLYFTGEAWTTSWSGTE